MWIESFFKFLILWNKNATLDPINVAAISHIKRYWTIISFQLRMIIDKNLSWHKKSHFWKIWLKRKLQQRDLSKSVYLVKRRWWPLQFCKWRNSFYTSANYRILWLIFLWQVGASPSHGWFDKLALKNT